MFPARPKKGVGCRVGVHWWSVLSKTRNIDRPGSSLPLVESERSCLFCGKVETYRMDALMLPLTEVIDFQPKP